MKTTEASEALKADLPQNLWGKVFAATPIVMTVMATILAGLSSSEMTRAQYERAFAAQMQSKAGDQWGLFQAKRVRSAVERSTLDLLSASFELGDVGALAESSAALRQVAGTDRFRDAIRTAGSPAPSAAPADRDADPAIAAAITALESSASEADMSALVARLDKAALDKALDRALGRVRDFEKAAAPAEEAIAYLDSALSGRGADLGVTRAMTALRLRSETLRYDQEARLNRAVANAYELLVRKGNLSAERHHLRSERFFYGMLGAQLAVIVATFAMAARQRNLLWSFAATAGLAAVGFALYVYLNV